MWTWRIHCPDRHGFAALKSNYDDVIDSECVRFDERRAPLSNQAISTESDCASQSQSQSDAAEHRRQLLEITVGARFPLHFPFSSPPFPPSRPSFLPLPPCSSVPLTPVFSPPPFLVPTLPFKSSYEFSNAFGSFSGGNLRTFCHFFRN